jgi:hypothetical protein
MQGVHHTAGDPRVKPLSLRRVRGARHRTRGQALVELGLVAPILLLLFAGAADFGRAFYAYVALDNAVKEGALYGATHPVCDDASASGCTAPNNVTWHVQNELNGLKATNGSAPVPTVQCLSAANGVAWANLNDCKEGDTYVVELSLPFRLITPVLGQILPNPMTLTSASRAIVFNGAIDATPPGGGGTTGGASVQKYIDPSTALNASDITSKCLEPDDSDANGFYRSPCLNSSTPGDPADTITARFDTGATINYRVVIGNSGAVALTGITISDCAAYEGTSCTATWPTISASCPARPNTLAVGSATYVCTYSKTAPNIPDSSATKNFVNNATVTANEISPAVSAVTAVFEKPAILSVTKQVSTFALGADGDGVPMFGTASRTVAYRTGANAATPYVWFYVGVTNIGGKTANSVQIQDSLMSLPFGQTNANADCQAAPASLAVGGSFTCRYKVQLAPAAGAQTNVVTATSPNSTGPQSDTATVTVVACNGNNDRVVPNLIGLTVGQAKTAWSTTAGFNKALTVNGLPDTATVVTQSTGAFECGNKNDNTSVTAAVTP